MVASLGDDVRLFGLVARNSRDYFHKFFDIVAAGDAVVSLRAADDEERIATFSIQDIMVPEAGGGWTERTGSLPDGGRIAQIAFTSGTQGEAKGVILTQANIASTVQRLRNVMHLDSSIREYVGVPVYHSFGLGRCRVVAAVGGRAYIPENGFDPREIAAMLGAGEINAISAVPTLWRGIIRNPETIGGLGTRVRWIEIGSQPMTTDEKLAMRRLFPNACIIQHYGLTEASRTTFLDISTAESEALESVGTPNGDIEVDMTEDGLIRIRGSNVAAEVVINGRRVANVDDNGWFVTKDLGDIQDGRLHFLGRADDMLNLGGLKVSADSIEAEVSSMLGIRGALSVVRISDPDRGDGVLLAVARDCLVADDKIVEGANAVLKRTGISASGSIRLMRVEALPRTDTGKVKRGALADIYETRRAAEKPPRAGGKGSSLLGMRGGILRSFGARSRDGIHDLYQELFPAQRITQDDTFISLGGDSLKFVEVSIALEQALGRLPDNWPELSIGELERIAPQRSLFKDVDTTVFLRAIGIVAVVTIHFTPWKYMGATFMLLLVAGFNFSRFQFRQVVGGHTVEPILLTAARVAVPAFLILLAIQTLRMEYYPDRLLLVSNFTGSQLYSETWYVESYVQILLLVSLVLLSPTVRALAARNLWGFTLVALALSVLIAAAGNALRESGAMPLAQTPMLSNQVPHMVIWLFVLGCLVEQASDISRKLLVCLVAMIAPLLMWWNLLGEPWHNYTPFAWVWAGCLILLFADRIPLPAPINTLAYWIGGASLFIYMTHWTVVRIWQRVTPVESDVLNVVVGVAGGVVCWTIWESLVGRLSGLRALSRSRRAA